MSGLVCRSIAIVLSLLPVVAPAAPAHKRPAPRWHGYGFLPGYHQPPNNSLPAYAQKASVSRMARHNRRPWYIDPIPSYYGYDGDWHYFGRPGFYGGGPKGGSFGPFLARGPLGAVLDLGCFKYFFKNPRGGLPFPAAAGFSGERKGPPGGGGEERFF